MSELQVGLLSVGAVVVAAVFLYNKWQERRYGRQAEVGFASRHEDVLMRSGGGAGQGTLQPVSRVRPRRARARGFRSGRGRCRGFGAGAVGVSGLHRSD